MKVTTYKTVDIEVEVDVVLEDCINELINVAEDGMPRLKLSAIDGATKVLEKITPEMVAKLLETSPNGRNLIRQRLQKWIEAT